MKKRFKVLLPFLLVSAIVLTALAPSLSSHGEASLPQQAPAAEASASKEEVVYANLGSDGSVGKIYVVNIFESTEGGTVKDYGDYESVLNLTDTSAISRNGEELTFNMGPGRFYYQGNLKSKILPWDFDISYMLNGVRLPAKELAGKSGSLEINIKTKESLYPDKAFYENYMLQISVTLDTSKCRNISAEGATIANAGKNKVVNFTVMPKSAGDLKLSALVTDFEMQPIQITAIPLSINVDIPGTESLSEDLSQFSSAIKQLNDGANRLTEGIGGLKSGFVGFSGGLAELRSGSSAFLGGIKALAEQAPALTEGSAAILAGLKSIKTSLESGELSGLAALTELPGALYQLSKATEQAATGLNELEKSFSQGYAALSAAVDALPSQSLDPSVLGALSTSTDPNVLALLGAYQAQYEAILRLKGTFDNLKPLFESVPGALSQSASGLSEISQNLLNISTAINASLTGSENLGESVGGLKSGIELLLTNYESFHQGLAAYAGGIKELENAYLTLDGGIGSLSNGATDLSSGIDELYGGASEYSAGINEFYRQTSDIDGLISDRIEELLSDYDKSDFAPSSFVSRGREVSSVQFVFKTEAITMPEPEPTASAEKAKPTFWEKLLGLFGL